MIFLIVFIKNCAEIQFNSKSNNYENYTKLLQEEINDILSNSLNNFYIDPKLAENEKGAVIQELRNIISKETYDFDYGIFKYLFPKYSHLEDFKSDINYK